jgi:hypothetical protein
MVPSSMHMAPVQVEQDVEVDEKHYERIHMPKFSNFRETLVLHDFTRVSVFDDHVVFSTFVSDVTISQFLASGKGTTHTMYNVYAPHFCIFL